MNDDKQLILDRLLLALQATSFCESLVRLELDPVEEIVAARYENGYVNAVYVKNMTGMQLIRAVVNKIG